MKQEHTLESLLLTYQQSEFIWNEERNIVSKMLELLKMSPSCFSREHECAHFTASTWILNKKKTHCLLTLHKKLGKWLQLGGHADGDLNLLRVAQKEGEEESGGALLTPLFNDIFDVDIHKIPAYKGVAEHDHYDVRFCFEINEMTSIKISDESDDLQWIPLDDLRQYTSERSMLRLRDKVWERFGVVKDCSGCSCHC